MEQDFGYQRERLETVSANLKARQSMVKNTQQLIAARINAVQEILDIYSNSSKAELESSGDDTGSAGGTKTKVKGKKKVIRRRRIVRRRR
jgi:hypothetical protein